MTSAPGRDEGAHAASILCDIAYILLSLAQDLGGEARNELSVLLKRVQDEPVGDGPLQDAVVRALSSAAKLERTPDRGWIVDISSILWAVYLAIYEHDTGPIERLWWIKDH